MAPEDIDSLDKDDLKPLVLALVEQNRVLTARVAELEARLELPPKTPRNSSLPPSTGQKANRPEPPAGSARKLPRKGRPGVARQLAETPDRVCDIYADHCEGCGEHVGPEDQPSVNAYDHIDLPPIKPIITRVNLHSGTCSCCGERIAARPPADMAPGSPFGPNIAALVVYWHTRQMVSYGRIKEMLKDTAGLDISEGAIANILARAGKPFAAEAERIADVVRASPVIASDETSARVKGRTWWQWVMGSDTAVSHRIADTRGAKVVVDFLAGARPEVWVSDRYSAQKGHGVAHQVCLAHLLRDTQYAVDTGDFMFAEPFKDLLKKAVAIGQRRDDLADATLKSHRRALEQRLDHLLARIPMTEAGKKLSEAIARWKDCLFVFVTRRDVPATNNVSERRLRMSVVFRKVTGCFRSVWGSAVYADIASVIATGALHGYSALDAIRACLAGRSVLNTS
jgi:transposase